MKDHKTAIIVAIALLVLSPVVRFVLVTEYAYSGGWVFYGLSFGAMGLLLLLMRTRTSDSRETQEVTSSMTVCTNRILSNTAGGSTNG